MALRNMVYEGDPQLRKKSREITEFGKRTADLMDDLKDTLTEQKGLGLAAPQVGVLRRAVVIVNGDEMIELINPEIIENSGEVRLKEACLSCPGVYGYVTRPQFVKVKAVDRNGQEFLMECEEMTARAACHEIDHLNGVLFVDLAEKILSEDDFDEEDDFEDEFDDDIEIKEE